MADAVLRVPTGRWPASRSQRATASQLVDRPEGGQRGRPGRICCRVCAPGPVHCQECRGDLSWGRQRACPPARSGGRDRRVGVRLWGYSLCVCRTQPAAGGLLGWGRRDGDLRGAVTGDRTPTIYCWRKRPRRFRSGASLLIQLNPAVTGAAATPSTGRCPAAPARSAPGRRGCGRSACPVARE